jgi:hypothetical protein
MFCNSSLTTDTQIQRAVHSVSHSHDSNQDTVTATKIVGYSCDQQSQAFTTTCRHYQRRNLVRRVIRREKAKHLPRTPVSLSKLELPDEWTTTGGAEPEDFLIHDSGPDAGSDMILVSAFTSAL